MQCTFIADMMLGRLAKWMRIMGCDVEYLPTIIDEELVERASRSGRIILTRDTLLIQRRKAKKNHFFISGDSYKEQLKQVVKAFSIDPFKHILTRCLLCNELLKDIDRAYAAQKVPPYVYETEEKIKTCPSCNRLYWEGTHRDEIVKQLKEIFGEW